MIVFRPKIAALSQKSAHFFPYSLDKAIIYPGPTPDPLFFALTWISELAKIVIKVI
jgi:hypothetical protein